MGTGQETAGDEAFRRAVAWLLEQPERSWVTLEQAADLFGLSVLESAVLFRYFSCIDPAYILEDHKVTMLNEVNTGADDVVPGVLGAEQVGAFRCAGYVVVRGLFDAGEVNDIVRWTDEVQAWPETAGRHMMYFERDAGGRRILNRMENVLPYHAGMHALATGSRLQGACGQLFGEPAVLFKDKINFKLPGGGGFEPHQDVQAGWARYASLHITALVTVDRATVANGCLEMASDFRGSHQLIGREWEPLGGAQLAGLHWTHIEAEPGDAVFFDSFIPHRSGPNRTGTPRRVLYYTYNRLSEGDHCRQYYADKRASYPPDIEREPGKEYRYRV